MLSDALDLLTPAFGASESKVLLVKTMSYKFDINSGSQADIYHPMHHL